MEMPTGVERLNLSTGERTLVRELAPVDRVGANAVYGVTFSADEKSYAYAFERISALSTRSKACGEERRRQCLRPEPLPSSAGSRPNRSNDRRQRSSTRGENTRSSS